MLVDVGSDSGRIETQLKEKRKGFLNAYIPASKNLEQKAKKLLRLWTFS
jgi:hypothetical protein